MDTASGTDAPSPGSASTESRGNRRSPGVRPERTKGPTSPPDPPCVYGRVRADCYAVFVIPPTTTSPPPCDATTTYGSSTASMTWMIPLLASTSVVMMFAPSMVAPSIAVKSPFSIRSRFFGTTACAYRRPVDT